MYIIILSSKNIFCNVHYIPIYRHPFYNKLGFNKKDYLNCEKYYQRTLTIPLYPELKKKSIDSIIYHINNFLDEYFR